jgi:ribose transport system permease protein
MGMTLVIATGGIDISVGSMLAVGAMVTAKLLPYGIFPAMACALLISAGLDC